MKDNIPNMKVLVVRGPPKPENTGFPGTRVTGSSESGSLLQDW